MTDEHARQRLKLAASTLLVGILIGVAAWVAISLSQPSNGVAAIWIGSGLLAGILMTSRLRSWVPYAAAALLGCTLAGSLHGDAPPVAFGRGFASTFEALIVAYALRDLVGDVNDPVKLLRVTRVAFASAPLACAASALIAATVSAAVGYAPFVSTFGGWFASHTLGMVIFATLTVVLRTLDTRQFARRGGYWKFTASMGLIAATTLGVFAQQRYPFLFMVYPPLLLATYQHRFTGFSVGITIIVVISIAATSVGTGPMSLVTDASLLERTLVLQLFLAITCLAALPIAIVLAERGRLAGKLRESERDYRMLADYSRDLIVRLRSDGRRLYVSPSSKELLGWEPRELVEPRWDLVHPDDVATLTEAMAKVLRTGDSESVIYRAQHKAGYYVWIEALGRRVPSTDPAFPAEIVYTGRDISERVQVERALADNQSQLRSITDNLPALVARIDSNERYTFANTNYCETLGCGPESILGQAMPAIVGREIYSEIRPHVQAAMRGERVTFEAERNFQGNPCTYEVAYVPDFAYDGSVSGTLILLFDISRLKDAERKLESLALHDSLTGLANRRQFGERLQSALARKRRQGRPLALLCLDIDKFKRINDTLGHAGGDAVLVEFARRLQRSVRESDLPARLGGDEFVVILEEVESADAAEVVASKILTAMQPQFIVDAATLAVTTSIGIAISASGMDAETLIRSADEALYQAKAAGRNTYRSAATT